MLGLKPKEPGHETLLALIQVLGARCGKPNLDDKAARDKIIAKAVGFDMLERLGRDDEELRHFPACSPTLKSAA